MVRVGSPWLRKLVLTHMDSITITVSIDTPVKDHESHSINDIRNDNISIPRS